MARCARFPARLPLQLRETAELRGKYEKLRAEHGFRLLDYTVDSELDRATRLFPVFRRVAGPSYRFFTFRRRRGRWTGRRHSGSDKQLCVEGLKHGERYAITLRAGLPSVVKETLAEVC